MRRLSTGTRCSRHQLEKVLKGLSSSYDKDDDNEEFKTKSRRAVVACLMRHPEDSADDDAPMEMLFILRSKRRGSRWSGHVGFPGGHVEEGESDEEAVVREVSEEVGVDLSRDGHARCIGKLRERCPPGADLTVCCHVFEVGSDVMVKAEGLQVSEVTAAAWIPISTLTSNEHVRSMTWRHQLTDWLLPSIPLASTCRDGDFYVAPASGVSEATARKNFNLWGLTLSMVSDLLVVGGLRRRPIDRGLLAFLDRLSARPPSRM